jgi:hypothetical protein
MSVVERSVGNGAVEVDIEPGKKLACLVCAHDQFHERNTLLNTRAATFFRLDWANASATNFVCTQCGYIHWFLSE